MLADIAALLECAELTLATTGEQGEPHAATLYFAAVQADMADAGLGLVLYYFSDGTSQHSLDITHAPRAAAAIFLPSTGWQAIQGLQLRGTVRQVDQADEWGRAWDHYRAKFPFVSELEEAVARTALYAFSPHWIRLIDNRRGFGFKQEWGNP